MADCACNGSRQGDSDNVFGGAGVLQSAVGHSRIDKTVDRHRGGIEGVSCADKPKQDERRHQDERDGPHGSWKMFLIVSRRWRDSLKSFEDDGIERWMLFWDVMVREVEKLQAFPIGPISISPEIRRSRGLISATKISRA